MKLQQLKRIIKEELAKALKEAPATKQVVIKKDKNQPNFVYVNIPYERSSGVIYALGGQTMTGQSNEQNAAAALDGANKLADKIKAKMNPEDIDVNDLENGIVQVFIVDDRFIDIEKPTIKDLI